MSPYYWRTWRQIIPISAKITKTNIFKELEKVHVDNVIMLTVLKITETISSLNLKSFTDSLLTMDLWGMLANKKNVGRHQPAQPNKSFTRNVKLHKYFRPMPTHFFDGCIFSVLSKWMWKLILRALKEGLLLF